MQPPESYHGREQAYIKHFVLQQYLERLFMIVGRNRPVIQYVDCFAGPWMDDSPDISNTSIARSLQVMAKTKKGLQDTFGRSVRFRALYIEKDPTAFDRLAGYLSTQPHPLETHCLQGDFLDLRGDILNWAGDDFSFFFIDPTGYAEIGIPQLQPLLRRPHSEFLINFMYNFINMAVAARHRDTLGGRMTDLFGEVPDVESLAPEDREGFLLRRFRERAKGVMDGTGPLQPRSSAVAVLDPLADRVKYHLVYLTRHPLGIVKFMEASESMDRVQHQVRIDAKLRAKADRTGQGDLFAEQPIELGGPATDEEMLRALEKYWLDIIPATPRAFTQEDEATILEDTNCFPGQLQKALKNLIRAERVKNLDAKRLRPKNAVLFEKGEQLVKPA